MFRQRLILFYVITLGTNLFDNIFFSGTSKSSFCIVTSVRVCSFLFQNSLHGYPRITFHFISLFLPLWREYAKLLPRSFPEFKKSIQTCLGSTVFMLVLLQVLVKICMYVRMCDRFLVLYLSCYVYWEIRMSPSMEDSQRTLYVHFNQCSIIPSPIPSLLSVLLPVLSRIFLGYFHMFLSQDGKTVGAS